MELKIKFKNLQKMMNTIPLIEKWIVLFAEKLPNFLMFNQSNMLGL